MSKKVILLNNWKADIIPSFPFRTIYVFFQVRRHYNPTVIPMKIIIYEIFSWR